MCTIVFIPKNDKSFVLGHNRDENPNRTKAEKPLQILKHRKEITAPVDGSKKGTWIYTSPTETVLLFNGAFQKHKHQPPYNRSRGLIVFETLNYDSHQEFIDHVDVTDVEPFTQIFIDHKTKTILELIWDGNEKVVNSLDWQPFIRSSVTLYNKEVHAIKESQFQNWLTDHQPEQLIDFMQNTDYEVPTMLEHPKVKTLSTSIVSYLEGESKMEYFEYT